MSDQDKPMRGNDVFMRMGGEGVKQRASGGDDDDVEGHAKLRASGDEDVEGHAKLRAAPGDDEDVEGHAKQR